MKPAIEAMSVGAMDLAANPHTYYDELFAIIEECAGEGNCETCGEISECLAGYDTRCEPRWYRIRWPWVHIKTALPIFEFRVTDAIVEKRDANRSRRAAL